MDWNQAKDQILVGLMGVGTTTLIWIAYSVSSLNIKIAVVLEKIANHDKRIEKLEENAV